MRKIKISLTRQRGIVFRAYNQIQNKSNKKLHPS
jgi:hypothetical protein